MIIDPRILALTPDITSFRRDIHAHPEIRYEEVRTAARVAEALRSAGVDQVYTGIGKTGVVGVIEGRKSGSGKVVGLRADMDALPITEIIDRPWKSTTPGKMHACGHDGHTSMLLGAARYLAATRAFDGRVVVIFQPAEEGGAGARAMIEDGLFSQHGINRVFGMHNMPGLPVGHFNIRPGPMMAAADFVSIEIEGKGSHAARPNQGIDSVVVGAHIITALQSIVARNVDPMESAVVSMCQFHAGEADNVVPQFARISGTVRTFKPDVQERVEAAVKSIATSVASGLGAVATVNYRRSYPAVVNDPVATDFAASIAARVGSVNRDAPAVMGSEDFSFMLHQAPGAFIFAGNGDTASLHHPEYDFNDDLTPVGIQYWATLVETELPLVA
jgi:amidohydrolase